jgi:glycerol kinase
MTPGHILAIDQGTTNTKVLLVNGAGAVVARASRPMTVSYPQPGWVEQDGIALWRTVAEAVDACLNARPGVDLAGVAITNQRESVIVWDRATGTPVGPCVVWQCRRTAPFCQSLRERGLGPSIAQKTGLPIDPLFSASKARWLLDAIPDGRARARDGGLCLGTVDSWLLWNISGGAVHACDRSNASRTQLYNLHTGTWDPELLDLFEIPRAALPDLRPSSGALAATAAIGRLPAGIPVGSLIGDSHAALFGHAAFRPGPVKATYGTGSSLMTLTATPQIADGGLATTVAWDLGQGASFAREGNITATGGAIDWLAQFLGLPGGPTEVAALAEAVPDSGGVTLVPAFAGLGAPHWDDRARALVHGLTLGSTPAHLARATLEAIAFQVRDVLEVMRRDRGTDPLELLADGGATSNDTLMQFQADILGCPVIRNRSTDLSACGAAWLCGLAIGTWTSLDELRALERQTDRFEPRMSERERTARYDTWRDAVRRARSSPDTPQATQHSTSRQTSSAHVAS